ncbi:hypothetical protein Avbf_03430 [Armadillidium vulgare]|nr:hypothetical protein Avbf_03430 [Armadillidium vulgare]
MDLEEIRRNVKWQNIYYLTLRIVHFGFHFFHFLYSAQRLTENGQLDFVEGLIFGFSSCYYTFLTISKALLPNIKTDKVLNETYHGSSNWSDIIIGSVYRSNKSNINSTNPYDLIFEREDLQSGSVSNLSQILSEYFANRSKDLESETLQEALIRIEKQEIFLWYVLPSFISVILQLLVFLQALRHRAALNDLKLATGVEVDATEMIVIPPGEVAAYM